MYKTPLPFIGGGLGSAASNKSKKEKEKKKKAKEEREKKQKEFKGVRAGNLERKANEILDNAKDQNRILTPAEQDKLKGLKSKAMSAESRQEKRNERYADKEARTELKRQSYINKMVRKGIMTAEQAEGRFNNIRGITLKSAELGAEYANVQTLNPDAASDDANTKAMNSPPPTADEQAQMNRVSEKTKIGNPYIGSIGRL